MHPWETATIIPKNSFSLSERSLRITKDRRYILHAFHGWVVRQRVGDQTFNASELCYAASTTWEEFLESGGRSCVSRVCKEYDVPEDVMVYTRHSRVWVHHDIAFELVKWCEGKYRDAQNRRMANNSNEGYDEDDEDDDYENDDVSLRVMSDVFDINDSETQRGETNDKIPYTLEMLISSIPESFKSLEPSDQLAVLDAVNKKQLVGIHQFNEAIDRESKEYKAKLSRYNIIRAKVDRFVKKHSLKLQSNTTIQNCKVTKKKNLKYKNFKCTRK